MKYNSIRLARTVCYLAVLTALVAVLQALGGTLTIGVVQLNFTLIPIVLGAVILGPFAGGFLGLVCGIVVLIQVAMGLVPFYVVIWSTSPVITAFTCLLKTTAAGVAAGWLYRLLQKKNKYVAIFVASAIVPIVNTGLFILGCLCMSGAIGSFQEQIDLGGMNILWFILSVIVTYNFFLELGVNLLLSPALYRLIKEVEKRAPKIKQKLKKTSADVTESSKEGAAQTEEETNSEEEQPTESQAETVETVEQPAENQEQTSEVKESNE